MTKNSYFPYTSTYSTTRHNTNKKHNIHHTPYTNTQHTSTLQGYKTTIFNNGRYTTNIPTDPPHNHNNIHKTNMRHIHTSIDSRHLATRGNNKILRTPPPHICSSEEILPRLTRRTLAQPRTNISPFLKSYLHKVDAKSHPSPLCPLCCNTHTHDTHHLFNRTHTRTILSPLELWTDPAGEAWWWTTSGNIGLPSLTRVMGVGRQHQQQPNTLILVISFHIFKICYKQILMLIKVSISKFKTSFFPWKISCTCITQDKN